MLKIYSTKLHQIQIWDKSNNGVRIYDFEARKYYNSDRKSAAFLLRAARSWRGIRIDGIIQASGVQNMRQLAQTIWNNEFAEPSLHIPFFDNFWKRVFKPSHDWCESFKTAVEMQENKTEQMRIGRDTYDQSLIPGVEPVSLTQRDIAALRAAKNAKRGQKHSMPKGGLFEELTTNQMDLF